MNELVRNLLAVLRNLSLSMSASEINTFWTSIDCQLKDGGITELQWKPLPEIIKTHFVLNKASGLYSCNPVTAEIKKLNDEVLNVEKYCKSLNTNMEAVKVVSPKAEEVKPKAKAKKKEVTDEYQYMSKNLICDVDFDKLFETKHFQKLISQGFPMNEFVIFLKQTWDFKRPAKFDNIYRLTAEAVEGWLKCNKETKLFQSQIRVCKNKNYDRVFGPKFEVRKKFSEEEVMAIWNSEENVVKEAVKISVPVERAPSPVRTPFVAEIDEGGGPVYVRKEGNLESDKTIIITRRVQKDYPEIADKIEDMIGFYGRNGISLEGFKGRINSYVAAAKVEREKLASV